MGTDDQVLGKKEYIVRTLAIHRPANPQVCWMDNSLSKQRHEPPTRVLQYYYIRGNAFQDGGLTDGNYIKYYCYYCIPIGTQHQGVPIFQLLWLLLLFRSHVRSPSK